MRVEHLSGGDVAGVASLCDRELVLDRDAGELPAVLMRRPYVGLVVSRDSEAIGACFGSVDEAADGNREGFIDLIVVSREDQRQGIGRLLLGAMEKELAVRGCSRVKIEGHPPHYAWPGIDIRYTRAICFAEDLGYRRGRCVVNMEVDLSLTSLETQADEDRLRSRGIEVRRANAGDAAYLQQSVASAWTSAWAAELAAALRNTQAGLYIACDGPRCVAFCAYGINRVNEIGPMGTWPDVRRLGIGTALIKRCLAEQRLRGLATAEIMWAGPLSYFSQTLNATISRAFWLYARELGGAVRGV